MFKLIELFKRKPGLSVEEFQQHWRFTHAPLVARASQIRRHVVSCALLQGYRKGELQFDGIAETWFDSAAACDAHRNDSAYSVIAADEAEFLDRSRTVLMAVDVHVIKDGPTSRDGVKNIEFIDRRLGMAPAGFSSYWRDVHGLIASRIPGIERYEQNHLKASAYAAAAAPPFDGVAVAWFPSTAEMKRGASTPEYAATRADEPNFLPDHELPIIIAREHVIAA